VVAGVSAAVLGLVWPWHCRLPPRKRSSLCCKNKRTNALGDRATSSMHTYNACLHLPLGHIFGRIARLRVFIVDQAQLAALFTWTDPIQANVEFGTVRGICEFGMWVGEPEGAVSFRQSGVRAFEAVFRNLVLCSEKMTQGKK